MSKKHSIYLSLLVGFCLLTINVINIPRGPLLHCYENITTYSSRQASYGFPAVFMQGNISGNYCSLPIDQLNEQNGLQGNEYHFRLVALVLDVTIAFMLTGLVYLFASTYKPHKKQPTTKPRRKHS